nr:hypothetical protein [Tanacetum cinerariifolium]
MEINIDEDENEPKLTYPYEKVDPLNPPPPASESKPDDEIEVENLIKHENETVFASIQEVGESSVIPFLRKDSDILLPVLIRRDIDSLFGRMASISRRLCGRKMAHALVEKKGKAKDKFYGKLILELGNENEQVEIDLYWTRVRAHEFYQQMIHRGFVFEERPNEAINVSIEDEKSPSSELRESSRDPYLHLTQAAIRRMIKDSISFAIAVEWARQVNVRNDVSGSGPVRGQDVVPAVRECTFAGFMKCNPIVFRGVEGAVELRRWFEKTERVFEISECAKGKKAVEYLD